MGRGRELEGKWSGCRRERGLGEGMVGVFMFVGR